MSRCQKISKNNISNLIYKLKAPNTVLKLSICLICRLSPAPLKLGMSNCLEMKNVECGCMDSLIF